MQQSKLKAAAARVLSNLHATGGATGARQAPSDRATNAPIPDADLLHARPLYRALIAAGWELCRECQFYAPKIGLLGWCEFHKVETCPRTPIDCDAFESALTPETKA